jgi:hypothetical protein
MNKEYKVIPFAEVAVGQEFESLGGSFSNPWEKISDTTFSYMGLSSSLNPLEVFPKGCLVRISDCVPALDTCTWTHKEHAWESDCGVTYTFTEEQDSLELNGFIFCHKCGCKITQATNTAPAE